MSNPFQSELKKAAVPGVGFAGAVGITALLYLLVVWVQREVDIVPPEEPPVVTPFALPPPPPPPEAGPPPQARQAEPIPFDIPLVRATDDISLDFLDLNFDVGPDATIEVDLDVDSYARKSLKESFKTPAIFERDDVDTKPSLVYSWTPRTPRELRGKRSQVHVMYVVNTRGRAEKIFVMDSTDPTIVEFVKESIQRWRFEPARKQGERVRVWVEQAFIIDNRGSSASPFSL